MLAPFDADAPDTPVWATVQDVVVPETLLDSAIEVEEPEQIAGELFVTVTVGIGFTTTATFIGKPEHPLAVGVIV